MKYFPDKLKLQFSKTIQNRLLGFGPKSSMQTRTLNLIQSNNRGAQTRRTDYGEYVCCPKAILEDNKAIRIKGHFDLFQIIHLHKP